MSRGAGAPPRPAPPGLGLLQPGGCLRASHTPPQHPHARGSLCPGAPQLCPTPGIPAAPQGDTPEPRRGCRLPPSGSPRLHPLHRPPPPAPGSSLPCRAGGGGHGLRAACSGPAVNGAAVPQSYVTDGAAPGKTAPTPPADRSAPPPPPPPPPAPSHAPSPPPATIPAAGRNPLGDDPRGCGPRCAPPFATPYCWWGHLDATPTPQSRGSAESPRHG